MTEPEKQHRQVESISFEAGFHRLEQILEQMNSNTISLDLSLKLFKEADQLINRCHKQLNDAGKEVEIMIKNRQGNPLLGEDQKPLTQNFDPASQTPPFSP